MLPNTIQLRTTCTHNGLELSDAQLLSLELLAATLLDWNKKINLISRRDEENFWTSHLLHSLSPLFKVELPHGARVLDLGTGGGLPGLPLKIARPDLTLTLLDSTQKKINVVNNLIATLGLQGTTAVWGRAEEVGLKEEYHRRYDVVVARAVGPLKDLVCWSIPFLKRENFGLGAGDTHGLGDSKRRITKPTLLAMKGGDLEGEIAQTQKLPMAMNIAVMNLTLKGSHQFEEGEKKIVLVELASTPKQKAD